MFALHPPALSTTYNYKIYTSASHLPLEWDILAENNIFLSKSYLAVLEEAPPENMQCHFIGLYCNGKLCGIAVSQYINLSSIATFKDRKKRFCLKDYFFKKFSSHTLIIGNNTFTGQNAYLLGENLPERQGLALLLKAIHKLKEQYKDKGIAINLLAIKDFNDSEWPCFKKAGYKRYYKFSTQPNMIFNIRKHWSSLEDYITDLNTKYRTQYNRARKKAAGINKRKFTENDINENAQRISELYTTVANRASFNTFFLPANHFYTLKQKLGDNFRFYGYFLDDRLVGFSTLIKNGYDMDTYFLGYDEKIQKEKLLYLNMLYDMAAYAIKKDYRHIIFARSAMEIKSSVGAEPEKVYGLIKHTNPLVNLFMGKLFKYFDPEIQWKPRSPFK